MTETKVVDGVTYLDVQGDSIADAVEVLNAGIAEEAQAEEGAEAEPSEDAEGEEPAQELAADEEVEETPDEVAEFSAKADLESKLQTAKREQRQEREEMKRYIHQMEQRMKGLESKGVMSRDAFMTELQKDPVGHLKRAGLTLDDVVVQQLETSDMSSSVNLDPIAQKLEKVTSWIEKQEEQKQVDAYRGDIREVLKDEQYELLASYPDAVDRVMNGALKRYNDFGSVDLTIAEIASRLQEEEVSALKARTSSKAVRKALGLPLDDAEETKPQPPPKKKASGPNSISKKMRAPSGKAKEEEASTPFPDESHDELQTLASNLPSGWMNDL